MPIRIGEFTTVSTSNLYFYPPLGTSSIAQGYLLATGPTGFMVPQNPNTLASTIVGGGYLDSTISTTISSTDACLAQTSTLTTYVSINTASISSLTSQVSTLSSGLLGLSNYVVANIGATPDLSTQVSDLTAGYSSLVYGFSTLSTTVSGQGSTLSNVSTGLALTTTNLSAVTQNVSSLSTTVSGLVVGQSNLSSFVSGQAAKLQSVSDSLSTTIYTVSSLSSIVSSQGAVLGQVGASLCTTVETVSSLSSVVAGLTAGSVTVGQFTDLSTYTSSLGASVGTLFLNVGAIDLKVSSLDQSISTISTQVSSLQSTTTYLLNNSLTNVGVLGLLSSQNNVWFGSNIQVSSVASNLYFNAGRIGIGTNAPTSNFTVSTTSLFSGKVNFADSLTMGCNVDIRRGISSLFSANPITYGVTIGSVAGPGNRLTVVGNTALQGVLVTSQDSYFYSTMNIFNGNFAVNTDTLFVSSGAGRVGVGCNAPAYTLDVDGSANISQDLIVDASTLVVSSGTNRVGIGCNSPDYTLDVAGTTHTSSLIVDSVISTNYIVQRTPLIWSYGLTGPPSLAAIPVLYNVTFNDPIAGYYSGGYFTIPFTGLYKIDVSANITAAVNSIGNISLLLSNTSGSNILWSGVGATAGADSQTTQVSYSFVSTFTSANSTKIYVAHANTLNVNTFSFGLLNIQFLG